MRTKLLWVLLAVSLTANVFLVAGALYTLYVKDDRSAVAGASVDSVAERLGLTPEQRDGLLALREKARRGHKGPREGRESRRAAFVAELGKPAFDREGVLALMEARSAQRRARIVDVAQDLHAYLATLSPEQRQAFLAMARERGFLRRLFGRPRPPRTGR
ncbi:MAG: Spy/CpxP family protein refolding chaperone [Proteobacteria bacterium]|nr:Spy/CpxP family protein refolding chaperone [Pseudomonadota bacterium]